LGATIGRLQLGWSGGTGLAPVEQARRFFYDTNVYDGEYLTYVNAGIKLGQAPV